MTAVQPAGSSTDGPHVCTEKSIGSKGARTQAAVLKEIQWEPGQTIRIKFLNGDAFLQNKVKQFAAEWLLYANLQFQYVSVNEDADIKIGFKYNNDGGSWSYLGTYCRFIPQDQPSMNFGWFTNSTSDTEFSRTTLHEFGHALGLIHEHQSPTANIPWDKPKVYAYYGGYPNYWTPAQVDNNIFAKYSTTQTNYSEFDSYSIMLYSISSSLTTNGYSTPNNTTLSNTDKAFIAQVYPLASGPDRLIPGQELLVDQFIQSTDGRFKLIMQSDGNLVLYYNNATPLWASNTVGRPITRCVMQGDGNLVLYDNSWRPYWASNTAGKPGCWLTMQNDGNLVIYQGNTPRWSSRTSGY